MNLVECSWEEIDCFVGNRCIVCYGCGIVADNFLDLLFTKFDNNRVIAFGDSNPNIKYKQYGDFKFDVWGLEQLRKNISNYVIIITCSDICGVIDQFEKIPELSNTYVFSMYQMLSYSALHHKNTFDVRMTDSKKIPSKIHYCWFGGKEKPEKYKKLIEEWHVINPDFEIIEWNEDNYDVKKNVYMKEAYEAEKWGFVPDYARLDILYNEGGIYLDTDIKVIKRLDDLLYSNGFMVIDSDLHVNVGSGMGAAKGNALLKDFLDYYENVRFLNRDGTLNMKTCSYHQQQVLQKYNVKNDGKLKVVKDTIIYPWGINGRDSYSHIDNITENTYWLHYGDGTWLTSNMNEAKRKRLDYLRRVNA